MKRISKIELENSRAYYDLMVFSLEKGQNLLLYGENGSGKTSLFRSLNDFIQSFYSPVEYTSNRYKTGKAGGVVLSIGDYDDATGEVVNVVDYRFADGVDNTKVAGTGFLKTLALTKGFLTYKDLLKVYLYDEDDPNLFKFFLKHLLKDHVALMQGSNQSLYKEYRQIKKDIFKVRNRNDLSHKRGLQELEKFERTLRSVLDNLFVEVNKYLGLYFDNFGLQIEYKLKPMTIDYGTKGKEQWYIDQVLRLNIKQENSPIEGFTEGLNEARLSAIAICLYLAALKANPGQDMWLMFLDDIFIGIDSANRLPILEILRDEFKDFQIIMATYDRSWYLMAKNYISRYSPNRWKFYNLFSLIKTEGGKTFTVPVITEGQSTIDKAKGFLHSPSFIDLPAAANYFRKALEELLNVPHLPKELFLSDDLSFIPGYKLTKHVEAVGDLFALIGENTHDIYSIASYLHPLIHPLSHYEEEAPIYRNELMEVEKAYSGLRMQIEELPKKCRLLFGRGNKLGVSYNTADGSYRSNYYLYLEDNLWLYKDAAGQMKLTDCECRTYYMEGWQNGVALAPRKIGPGIAKFAYHSLDEALQTIHDYEVNVMNHAVVAHSDYDIVFVVRGKNFQDCITIRRDSLWAAM